MLSFFYVSCLRVLLDTDDIVRLVERAQQCNAKFAITGYLYANDEYFLQYIEGPAGAIQQLVKNLLGDVRHQVIHQFYFNDVARRLFPDWHMRYLPDYLQASSAEEKLINSLGQVTKSGTPESAVKNYVMSHIRMISTFHLLANIE